MTTRLLRTLAAWLFALAFATNAAELTLKVSEKEPPKEIDASVRPLLQGKAIQLLEDGQPVLEFWFCSEVAMESKPASVAKALDSLKQPVLLGAAVVSKSQRDYRDDELAPGIYTMRFGLQPNDGNHLGTAEFPYFALLVPARHDLKPDGIATYKALVKASSKETSSDHPRILSLRPASTDEGDMPGLNDPLPDHKSVRVKVPGKIVGKDEKNSLVFEIVYRGMGHK